MCFIHRLTKLECLTEAWEAASMSPNLLLAVREVEERTGGEVLWPECYLFEHCRADASHLVYEGFVVREERVGR